MGMFFICSHGTHSLSWLHSTTGGGKTIIFGSKCARCAKQGVIVEKKTRRRHKFVVDSGSKFRLWLYLQVYNSKLLGTFCNHLLSGLFKYFFSLENNVFIHLLPLVAQ